MIDDDKMEHLARIFRPRNDDVVTRPELTPAQKQKHEAIQWSLYVADIRERYQKIQAVHAGWITVRWSPELDDWEHCLTEDLYDDDSDEGETE